MNNALLAACEDEGEGTMDQDYNERVCTFCDKMAVLVVRFGAYSVHMCDHCARPEGVQ